MHDSLEETGFTLVHSAHCIPLPTYAIRLRSLTTPSPIPVGRGPCLKTTSRRAKPYEGVGLI
jgi:hypothetical protein